MTMLTCSRLAHLVALSNKCWLAGISLSLVSSTASLVSLRAESRRLALSSEIARREGSEKEGPDSATASVEERRAKGRAMIQCVFKSASRCITNSMQTASDATLPVRNGHIRLCDPCQQLGLHQL